MQTAGTFGLYILECTVYRQKIQCDFCLYPIYLKPDKSRVFPSPLKHPVCAPRGVTSYGRHLYNCVSQDY